MMDLTIIARSSMSYAYLFNTQTLQRSIGWLYGDKLQVTIRLCFAYWSRHLPVENVHSHRLSLYSFHTGLWIAL